MNNLTEEYKPISPWGYFGLELLYSIPIVGFIILIVNCFNKNVNRKNFARSYFIGFILIAIIVGVLLVLGINVSILNGMGF